MTLSSITIHDTILIFLVAWIIHIIWYITTYKSRHNNPKFWVYKTSDQAHDWITKSYHPDSQPYLEFMESVEFEKKLYRHMLELKSVQDRAAQFGIELAEVESTEQVYDIQEPEEETKVIFEDGNEIPVSEYSREYKTLLRHLGLIQNRGKSIVYKNGNLTIA